MPPQKKTTTVSGHKVPFVVAQLMEPDEQVLTVVHKSLIVLIGLYLEITAGAAALVAILLVASPNTLNSLFNGSTASLLILSLLVALVVVILALVTSIYLENELVLTNESLIEVVQRGPFMNKASRLSFSNVEDVSANQSGLLATLFNYGNLLIQTAGTMDNFLFTYCPNPNQFAHQILMAREAYAQSLREANEHQPQASATPIN